MDHENTGARNPEQKRRTSETIAMDIAKFLEAGGKIQRPETSVISYREAQNPTSSPLPLEDEEPDDRDGEEVDDGDSNDDYQE